MSSIFEPDRGGKWRQPQGPAGVPRQHGKIGADFVNFLTWHEEAGGNIRWNASSFMLTKKYTDEQRAFFINVLDMYIHKVLRKMPKDEE